MIYDVRQTSFSKYASEVSHARHILRLTPIDRAGQRVQASTLDISPAPAERVEGRDFFGNRVTWILMDAPHTELTVNVAARIVVAPSQAANEEKGSAWEIVRDSAFAINDIGPQSPAHFLFSSPRAPLSADMSAYAQQSFPPGWPVIAGCADLTRRIKADFAFDSAATNVATQPAEAFAIRRGVCQDFAHIMIAGLRGIGLPAAYVSGYLRTVPPPGMEPLQGADAMHAWVSVWGGRDRGWVGFDPTNGVFAGESHLVVAIGRDYSDVAPIDGVVLGAGGQQLGVSVTVTPVVT